MAHDVSHTSRRGLSRGARRLKLSELRSARHELPGCSKRRMNMSTISVMRTGHYRLEDGSLLRVDIECGRWVGSLYTRDMRVKTRVVGSDVEVHAGVGRLQQRNKLAA